MPKFKLQKKNNKKLQSSNRKKQWLKRYLEPVTQNKLQDKIMMADLFEAMKTNQRNLNLSIHHL